MIRVVGRVAVVREQRNGNSQNENAREGNGRWLVSHRTPPFSCTEQQSVLRGRPRIGAIPTISVLIAQMGTLYIQNRSE
jgi:hypothetical protein